MENVHKTIAPEKPPFISPWVDRFLERLLYGTKKEQIEVLESEIQILEHVIGLNKRTLEGKRERLQALKDSQKS